MRISRVEGVSTAQFHLKGIKQDTLGQRAAARGDGDWVIVAATGDKFDITMWLQLYEGTHPDDEPLFVDAPDGATPWVYTSALNAVRELWARTPGVSAAEANTCGLHGLRVSGNVGVTRGLGKETAKAQGGWESDAQDRYHRVGYDQVVQIPGANRGVVASTRIKL